MSAKSEFEALQVLYQAIVDIDRSINRPRDDNFAASLLEDVLNDIKFINKKEFSDKYTLPIVNNIREAVVEMYKRQQEIINDSLSLSVPKKRVDDKVTIPDGRLAGDQFILKDYDFKLDDTYTKIDLDDNSVKIDPINNNPSITITTEYTDGKTTYDSPVILVDDINKSYTELNKQKSDTIKKAKEKLSQNLDILGDNSESISTNDLQFPEHAPNIKVVTQEDTELSISD